MLPDEYWSIVAAYSRWYLTLSQVEKHNPYGRIALTNATYIEEKAAGLSSGDLFLMWYPVVDAFGTFPGDVISCFLREDR